jgi:hypothetical protein
VEQERRGNEDKRIKRTPITTTTTTTTRNREII